MKGLILIAVKNDVSSDEYNKRLKEFEPMLNNICAKHARNSNEHDEFMSIAKEQLLYALMHFNPSRSKLITFIWKCVNTNIIQAKIKELNYRNKFIPLNDFYSIIDPVYNNNDDKILVKEILKDLVPHEYNILINYYLKNMTLSEISNVMKISVGSVHRIRNRVINKLRRKFSVERN